MSKENWTRNVWVHIEISYKLYFDKYEHFWDLLWKSRGEKRGFCLIRNIWDAGELKQFLLVYCKWNNWDINKISSKIKSIKQLVFNSSDCTALNFLVSLLKLYKLDYQGLFLRRKLKTLEKFSILSLAWKTAVIFRSPLWFF